MKIRLKINIPVHTKHGLTKGRVKEVEHTFPEENGYLSRWQVRGDTGELVNILAREAEEVKEGGS